MTASPDKINARLDTRYLRRSMTHAPSCYRPELPTPLGHCVTIGRCPSCGAIASLRHGAHDNA